MSVGETAHLSVVVPVYGCKSCLAELCRRLFLVADELQGQMEIILVNDASPDRAWEVIRNLADGDARIKGINLFRNFGQHAAISAGLKYAEGDWVVVMDCDLQDIPEELPKLYRKALEGFDAVFGRRAKRQDNAMKRFSSFAFYRVLSLLAGEPIDGAIANYSIISRSVVLGFRQMAESHRSYGLLVDWLGPRTAYIDIEHAARPEGGTSYSVGKLFRLAADVIVSFSTRPLTVSVYLGFMCATFAVLAVVFLLIRYLTFGVAVAGWASTVVSVWFLGGLILGNLGVMGLYLGKVFEQVKQRPLFLVSNTVNAEPTKRSNIDARDRMPPTHEVTVGGNLNVLEEEL